MIDWSKPIQTRDGHPARLICSDTKQKDRPYLVLILDDGTEYPILVSSQGWVGFGGCCPADIINVPPPKISRTVTFYLCCNINYSKIEFFSYIPNTDYWKILGQKNLTIEEGEGL